MHSVYISYSGKNCEAVLQVMEVLVRKGYAIMCECMLPYGEAAEAQARKQIRGADAMVAVITDDAADCPYMARDLAWAKEAEQKLLTVRVENAVLPHGLQACCRISEYPTEAEMAVFIEKLHGLVCDA